LGGGGGASSSSSSSSSSANTFNLIDIQSVMREVVGVGLEGECAREREEGRRGRREGEKDSYGAAARPTAATAAPPRTLLLDTPSADARNEHTDNEAARERRALGRAAGANASASASSAQRPVQSTHFSAYFLCLPVFHTWHPATWSCLAFSTLTQQGVHCSDYAASSSSFLS